jgi:hypothetical protein
MQRRIQVERTAGIGRLTMGGWVKAGSTTRAVDGSYGARVVLLFVLESEVWMSRQEQCL